MNMAELQKKLFAAARSNPPSDDVPYAFEERILGQVAAKTAFDILAAWNRTLWQAAAPCVAIMLLLGSRVKRAQKEIRLSLPDAMNLLAAWAPVAQAGALVELARRLAADDGEASPALRRTAPPQPFTTGATPSTAMDRIG